eukprot:SAG11_NODE_29058_length_315_cov_0.546296_1_plen_96_part_10
MGADQGENNMHNIVGNSAQGVGYGCQMVDLVATWRQPWSKVEGTTDPLAWFGAQQNDPEWSTKHVWSGMEPIGRGGNAGGGRWRGRQRHGWDALVT